jgi:peptidylprolyl isomerase
MATQADIGVLLPVIVACAAIGFVGCGDADSSASNLSQNPTGSLTNALKRLVAQVRIPEGPPPKALIKRDLIEGAGPSAALGREVTIRFVGFDYKTGTVVGAPWDGKSTHWKLGTKWVLRGMEKGVEGMKVGGRRQLIIPPRLAFGPDSPPKIPPNETMVYMIELLKIG